MPGLLSFIFSEGDRLKRKVNGLLDDPSGTVAQHIGLLNDKAGAFNRLHSEATQESVNSLRGGGNGMGPKSQQLAGLLADAYNPVGMVAVKGPQSEALETARKNAVKMLGLPENNTPMDRAKAMGFDTNLFHGSGSPDIASIDSSKFGTNTRMDGGELGFFATSKPILSDHYAELGAKGGWHGRSKAGNATVYPLMVRSTNPKKYETASAFYRDADINAKRLNDWRSELSAAGHDAVFVRPDLEEVAVLKPENVRSRFAAFDPARIHENDLLGRVNLPMLGLLGAGAGGAAYLTKEDR